MLNYTREQMDSNEEFYSMWYFNELLAHGILLEAEFHPQAFELSNPVYNYYIEEKLVRKKVVKKTVFRESMKAHVYTADWRLVWNPLANLDKFVVRYDEKLVRGAIGCFQAKMIDGKLISYIDIKGGAINPYMNSTAATFGLNQKWVYSKLNIFVQKVIPIYTHKVKMKQVSTGLFVTTFTPNRYLQTDGGQQRRILHYQAKSFTQYYNG